MPTKRCQWGNCNSDSRYKHKPHMTDVFFIPFPKAITNLSKCLLWIKLCGVESKLSPHNVRCYHFVCSKHFVGGAGPTDLYPHPIQADAIQTSSNTAEDAKSLKRKRKKRLKPYQSPTTTPPKLPSTSLELSSKPSQFTIEKLKKLLSSTPSQLPSTPSQLSSTTSQLPSTPSQLSSTSSQLPLTPSQLSSTSSQLPSTPSQISSTPPQLPSTPSQISSRPSQLPSTPSHLSSTPSQLPSTPSQISSRPSQLPSTPSQLSSTPSQLPSTPSQISSTPSQLSTTSQVSSSTLPPAPAPHTLLRNLALPSYSFLPVNLFPYLESNRSPQPLPLGVPVEEKRDEAVDDGEVSDISSSSTLTLTDDEVMIIDDDSDEELSRQSLSLSEETIAFRLGTRRESEDVQIQAKLARLEKLDISDEEKARQAKQLRMLAFVNPGKFMDDFDPERSTREIKKMNRRLGKEKTSLRRKQFYDEQGCLPSLGGMDLCDCLEMECPGCHMPCPKCNSEKCGSECRVNRKWVYDFFESEGTGKVYSWPKELWEKIRAVEQDNS